MSKCIVEVCLIDEIKAHPNADKLEIAIIKGWQCITQKGQHRAGDKVVYFPPDTVIPQVWSDTFGVTQYLSKGRIRSIKLRGEPSFGLMVKVPYEPCSIGDDLADYFGATKYEPPPVFTSGGQNPRKGHAPKSWVGRLIQKWTWIIFNMEPDHVPELQAFPVYTEIENLRHFNRIFEPGEPVVVTEKIHGACCRVGVVAGEELAGSHFHRRLRPKAKPTFKTFLKRLFRLEDLSYGEEIAHDYYGYPWSLSSVQIMLKAMAAQYGDVVLYGEVYGKVQELKYGHPNDVAFAAFDLMVNGKYLSARDFEHTCDQYAVPRVPVLLMESAFSLEDIKKFSTGKSIVQGADNIREGVVIRPMQERTHPKLGRVILKYVGDEYLCSKKCNENKDV